MENSNNVNEEIFNQFILEQYAEWLEGFLEIIQDRLNHCSEEDAPKHLYREMEIKTELENVRGLY